MSGNSGDSAKPFFEVSEIVAGTFDPSGASIVHQDDYPKYEIADGVIFCPVFNENTSLNFVTFPANSGFPPHTHPEEQVSIIREGHMEFTVGDITQIVKPGDVIVMPPDIPHAGRTFDEACRVIDIFSPPRYGMKELLADADPLRSADIDRWWAPEA